jgi:hypothetical protein
MAITYDSAKREWTLRERWLDFQRAAEVFEGPTIDIPDCVGTMANCGSTRSGTWVDAWCSSAGRNAETTATSFQ